MYLRVAQEQLCSNDTSLPSIGSAQAAFPNVISTMKVLRLPVPNAVSLMDSLARSNPSSPRLLPLRQRDLRKGLAPFQPGAVS